MLQVPQQLSKSTVYYVADPHANVLMYSVKRCWSHILMYNVIYCQSHNYCPMSSAICCCYTLLSYCVAQYVDSLRHKCPNVQYNWLPAPELLEYGAICWKSYTHLFQCTPWHVHFSSWVGISPLISGISWTCSEIFVCFCCCSSVLSSISHTMTLIPCHTWNFLL